MLLLPSMLSRIACNWLRAFVSLRFTLTDLLARVSKSTRKMFTLPAPSEPALLLRLAKTWASWSLMVSMALVPILPELSTMKAIL
ncbi:hypothetical protein D3C78_1317820 [compost metagenome]